MELSKELLKNQIKCFEQILKNRKNTTAKLKCDGFVEEIEKMLNIYNQALADLEGINQDKKGDKTPSNSSDKPKTEEKPQQVKTITEDKKDVTEPATEQISLDDLF